jgi:excisionase family DNA binding protein
MTVRELAAHLGVRRETVYAWIRERKIDVTLDVTGQYRIPYLQAAKLVEEHETAS